jgi:S1-C subfamily serine protease
VDTLRTEVDSLIATGTVTRPALGLSYLEASQAKLLGINNGILIMDITSQSAAEKAGLRPTIRGNRGDISLGDIILSIDQQTIRTEADLIQEIEKHKIGDIIDVNVVRGTDLDHLPAEVTNTDEDDTNVDISTIKTFSKGTIMKIKVQLGANTVSTKIASQNDYE